MEACSIGLHNLVKKTLNNKPYFSYKENGNFGTIVILDSFTKKINIENSIGVAGTVATSINTAINNGYKNIGNVAFVGRDNYNRGIVNIKATDNQLNLINAIDNSKEAYELQKEVDKEREIEEEKALRESRSQEIEENREYFENDEPFTRVSVDEKPIPDTGIQGTLFQNTSPEGQIASEKTIRELAARMSDRIGIPFKIESDKTKEYKGKIENNIAYINLAYATLDTPIHEILVHPIIRAIRNRKSEDGSIEEVNTFMADYWDAHPEKSRKEVEKYVDENFKPTIISSQLYENLLKELETGRGKEVLDRIKKDYNVKGLSQKIKENWDEGFTEEEYIQQYPHSPEIIRYTLEEQQEEAIVELLGMMAAEKLNAVKDGKLISLLKRLLKEIKAFVKSLISQKEVEIDKLPDNMTLGDLANILAYSNSKLILPGYEVEYTTPDNIKFKTYQEASNHISELAKSVKDVDLNKNISVDNIDKEIETLQKELDNFKFDIEPFNKFTDVYTKKGRLRQNYWARKKDGTTGWTGGSKETLIEPEYDGFVLDIDRGDGRFITKISDKEAEELYYAEENKFNTTTKASREKYAELETKIHNLKNNSLKGFIEKNKKYEQSKEIIEEWKKVNNIQYNPEEIYSRGQKFSSVVGAYSSFDVNLMMQNLLQHIEDNEKAGGQFAISAYTKPIDKQIGHLEGGGGKIKFKIYPKSGDILWAANTDVYSGSVWDASEKVNKDKESELLGVSYTKYPSLSNVNEVQPNLASIVDDLAHHHNELGIVLTGNNFRLEYDEDIPYQTKKIIDSINSILDQKYGKLVKPDITANYKWMVFYEMSDEGDTAFKDPYRGFIAEFDTKEEANRFAKSQYPSDLHYVKRGNSKGISPKITNETLKESINDIRNKLGITKNPTQFKYDDFALNDIVTIEGKEGKYKLSNFSDSEGEIGVGTTEIFWDLDPIDNEFDPDTNPNGLHPLFNVPTKVMTLVKDKKEKEYTSQALINTKIAALKEVAKKYPRSLIRSEVKPIFGAFVGNTFQPFDPDDLLFQKISGESLVNNEVDKISKEIKNNINKITNVVDNVEETVESYRAQEQAELSQRIPNIENYKVNGKVDKSLITDENDLKTYNEIYNKYDALITPLLETSEETKEQPEDILKTYEEDLEQGTEDLEDTEDTSNINEDDDFLEEDFPVEEKENKPDVKYTFNEEFELLNRKLISLGLNTLSLEDYDNFTNIQKEIIKSCYGI